MSSDTEQAGPRQPKRPRRDCKYKTEWKSFGVSSSRKGSTFAHCDVCRTDFSVAHAGVNDIKKHVSTAKHNQYSYNDY